MLSGSVAALILTPTSSPAAVTLEPVGTQGANPFMPPVGTDQSGLRLLPGSGGNFSGATPGLYGGTLRKASCNPQQLVSFLHTHPGKAAAWAGVFGIRPADIPGFVAGLTSAVLRSDTAITNHGYIDGHITSFPAVLEAGTAVLIDRYGQPVTKCFCGNPLTKPMAYTQATYTGKRWPSFSATSVTYIQKTTTPEISFTLVNPVTGTAFRRAPSRSSSADQPLATPPPGPSTAPATGSSTTPATGSSTTPGDRIVDYPGDRVVDHPGDRVVDYPGDRVLDHPGDRVVDHPGDRVVDYPGDRVVDHPGDRVLDYPGDRVLDYPGDRVVDHPGDRVLDHPRDRIVDHPGDRVVDYPGDRVVDHPGDRIVGHPGDRVVDQTGNRIVDHPRDSPRGHPVGRSAADRQQADLPGDQLRRCRLRSSQAGACPGAGRPDASRGIRPTAESGVSAQTPWRSSPLGGIWPRIFRDPSGEPRRRLAWSAERGLDPLAARRPHLELYSGGCRRSAVPAPRLAVTAADACPDVSVNQGAERRRVPRRRVGGHGAGLGMAQKHDEDGRQGPDKADGTRDQPYNQLEVHHGPPLFLLPP